MRHPTQSQDHDERRNVARLDETMRVERQEQGTAWTKLLKRRLSKRFDIMTSPTGR